MPPPDVIELLFASTAVFGDSAALDDPWPLSAEERERAARFVFEKDRRLFVLGKRLVRTVLGRALGSPPESLDFAASAAGKPALAGPEAGSGLAFNLAHSGQAVVCALARHRPVGVDVEVEREDLDLLELAQRFFCANEIQRLAAGPAAETRRLFFKYWTLKEAYLKAEGSGLGISLTAMDASGVPDGFPAPASPPVEDQPRGLLVQPLAAPAGYAAAVASSGPPWRVERHDWRVEDFGRRPY